MINLYKSKIVINIKKENALKVKLDIMKNL